MSRLDVANAAAEEYTTPDERAVAMARMYAEEGLTYEEIGKQYGVTRQRVEQILKPFGIPAHWGQAKKERRAQVLGESYGQISGGHATMKEEAERLGYANAASLWQAFHALGLEMPKRQPSAHGSLRRYNILKCRCEICREGARVRAKERRERGPTTHGSASSYVNYGCRCPECREAVALYRRELRARRRQERQPTDG